MTSRLTLVIAAVVAIVVALYVWPTDTRAVRHRVVSLVDALNAAENETDLSRLGRAATLSSAMTANITVTMDDTRRLSGREAVLAAARQVMQTRQIADVDLTDLRVDVASDRSSAIADATIRVDGDSYHDVRLTLVKENGTWLVSDARVLQPLARPGVSR